MVDQTSQFYAILTNIGAAKQANADALGIPWRITQMAVGDANGSDPTPNATQTRLINEWRRAPLNQLKVDEKNSAVIVAEQVIPAEIGGRWIREIALYDADGDMVAVANCPPTFKPLLNQGSGRTQVVRMNLLVSSSSNVELRIDPSVVLATREYVDRRILEVLPPDKPEGTYTKVTINARGVVTAGSNPTSLAGYGIQDAIPNTGGRVKGNLIMDPGWGVVISPANSPSWAAGVHVADPDSGTIYASLGFWGDNKNMRAAYLGLGPTAWATGNAVRVTPDSVTVTGSLVANVSSSSSVPFSTLTGLPNTLAGHGILMASQTEAENGADTTKPMSALRVWQAIGAKVIQATESLGGIARIASQVAVNVGTDALAYVTPRTLANGLQLLIGTHGFVRAPSWLGGIMLQWGTGPQVAAGQTITITYPLAYPTAHFMTIACNNYSAGGPSVSSSLGVLYGGREQFTVSASGASGQPSVPWFSIGY